ncbi:hypothetical protein K437DRAFT_270468 [Tilletiaria anomala UBC 951]|uniref:Uncharacterized protein n=1 Tax=Tilletiaria anomala (strain ATCC 24038 / CBS 436.72 / UBC 951) TaxID=1037660 RepID=A0A066VJ85_TILAU|nr:uncharacterized protein K437DRAFT_270468 [Tilletiaria anomala UBC 951]KDN38789.1 hypothetical protein K437DRAFT_270468 [Tilletiaria anomala UBC 951]
MPQVRRLKVYATRVPWAAAHELVQQLKDRQDARLRKESWRSRHGLRFWSACPSPPFSSPSCTAQERSEQEECLPDRLQLDELSVRFQGSDLHHALTFYELVSPRGRNYLDEITVLDDQTFHAVRAVLGSRLRVWSCFPEKLQWPQLRSLKLGGFLYDTSFTRSLSLVPNLVELELQGSANTNLDVDVIITPLCEQAPIGRTLRRLSVGGCPAPRRNLLELQLEKMRHLAISVGPLDNASAAGDSTEAASAQAQRGAQAHWTAQQPRCAVSVAKQMELLRWKELEMTQEPLDLLGDLNNAAQKLTL